MVYRLSREEVIKLFGDYPTKYNTAAPNGKQRAHLDDWYAVTMEHKGGTFKNLWGYVSGHPRLPDGRWIHTTILVMLDEEGRKAESVNTEYTLGEPSKTA